MPAPILYSFRRCPYAIRARMAIHAARIKVELREVELKNKPAAMLAASAKGTVPVLIDIDGTVIDESLDIMRWALQKNDPMNWLDPHTLVRAQSLIKQNDNDFKKWLDKYKYHVGHPEQPQSFYRDKCEEFFLTIEQLLTQQRFMLGDTCSIADIAIFPFIRQCAFVDKPWFNQAPYPKLRNWLNHFLEGELFLSVMEKYPTWDKLNCPTIEF